MSRDLLKFVRFAFFYNPRRRVSRPRRRRRLIETTGRSRNIVKGRAARPLQYYPVVAPRWRPSSHRARRRRRSSRSPRRSSTGARRSPSRASSRGKWILLPLHSRSRSRRRRRRRCFVKLRRRGAFWLRAMSMAASGPARQYALWAVLKFERLRGEWWCLSGWRGCEAAVWHRDLARMELLRAKSWAREERASGM